MKRPAPEAQEESDNGATWHCYTCDNTMPVAKFAKWAMESKQHICRCCALKRSLHANMLRKGSLDRILMARLRRHMNRNGSSLSTTQRLDLSEMQKLVKLQGARSILSGISDPDRLTVCRWKNSESWSFPNLVILTYAESREHNKKILTDYNAAYVSHVETHLLMRQVDASLSTIDPPYPPKSSQTKGLQCDVVLWYIQEFNVTNPVIKRSRIAIR
jgi:hypothetical protein